MAGEEECMALPTADNEPVAGFAVLDDKGRLPVAEVLRDALGLVPGSAVGYVLLDGMLLVIPQDAQLAQLTERAAAALARAGLATDDLLAAIPAAHAEVVRERYGESFLNELAQKHGRSSGGVDGG